MFVKDNKEIFERCYRLNRIAHNLIYRNDEINVKMGKLDFYIFTILFVRSASNFQSAVILLRNGMLLEAKILVRSCLECAFMLGATRNMGAEFVTRLINAHNEARKKFGDNLISIQGKTGGFSADQIKELEEIVTWYKNNETKTFDFYEIAKKGGLEAWYVFYRRLSNYAAHPSFDSLQYFFEFTQEIITFEPNQDGEELLEVVDMACTFLISCCENFNQHLGEDTNVTALLAAEFQRIQRWQETDLSDDSA